MTDYIFMNYPEPHRTELVDVAQGLIDYCLAEEALPDDQIEHAIEYADKNLPASFADLFKL